MQGCSNAIGSSPSGLTCTQLSKHANQKMRHAAARAVAQKAGFLHDDWSDEERTIAGVWCANLLTEGLPDVFRWAEYTEWNKVLGVPEKKRTLVISDEAHEYMRAAIADTIKRRPVWLPRYTTGAVDRLQDQAL
jgi:hypothetical protein